MKLPLYFFKESDEICKLLLAQIRVASTAKHTLRTSKRLGLVPNPVYQKAASHLSRELNRLQSLYEINLIEKKRIWDTHSELEYRASKRIDSQP